MKKKYVIGIDFGTSGTGFCVYDPEKPDEGPFTKETWKNATTNYPKNLTQIMYKNNQPISYGYTARKTFSKGGEDTKLIKYFKMDLKSSTDGFINGTKIKVVDAIAHYLKYIVDEIKKDYEFSNNEVKWCLTVPAIWSEREKDLMVQASVKAKMIESTLPSDNDFQLILEPEAAAMIAIKYLRNNVSKTKLERFKFIVVDIGGGTSDLTAYSYNEGHLSELVPGKGNTFGSSNLNKNFIEKIKKLVGEKTFGEWEEDNDNADCFLKLDNSIEEVKMDMKDYSSISISLPRSLEKMLKNFKLRNGKLKLTEDQVKEICSPVFESILKLVKSFVEEIKMNDKLDYAFLVGGFGKNDLLQEVLRNYFSSQKINFIVPFDPCDAVLKGSVLYDLKKVEIKKRKLRMTYGVSVVSKEKDMKNPEVYELNNDPVYKYKYVEVFSRIGETVLVDGVIEKSYVTWSDKNTQVTILESSKENPKISECSILGKLVVQERGKDFKIQFYFGKENIRVFVEVEKKQRRINIEFNNPP